MFGQTRFQVVHMENNIQLNNNASVKTSNKKDQKSSFEKYIAREGDPNQL